MKKMILLGGLLLVLSNSAAADDRSSFRDRKMETRELDRRTLEANETGSYLRDWFRRRNLQYQQYRGRMAIPPGGHSKPMDRRCSP